MVPKLIHQTWHSQVYEGTKGDPASWKAQNPDWDYRLWTDDALDAFVAEHYPDFIDLFRGYPKPVFRADLGRYLLLHHFGGVYADIDTDCLRPLDVLCDEERIVVCEEPSAYWWHATRFGLRHLLFNGTLASPAGHAFWLHLAERAKRCWQGGARDVIWTTGPGLLTGAIDSWPDADNFSINSCHLFTGNLKDGTPAADAVSGDYAQTPLSQHNWAGTWHSVYTPERDTLTKKCEGLARKAWARLATCGPVFGPEHLATIDRDVLQEPVPALDPQALSQVAVFVPVKDGARFLDRHMELIEALDWPKNRLRLIYCEGDSRDDSREKLEALRAQYGNRYAGFELLEYMTGYRIDRKDRAASRVQRKRRGIIAQVRNAIIDRALMPQDDWVLWIDVDVCDFAPDILRRMLAEQAKIVAPNCLLKPGGNTFDLNSFVEHGTACDAIYYKYFHDGLFQPPPNYPNRHHLHHLRALDRVELSAVGGTMLLVQACVHRAGVRFPEVPYRDLIETEGFGRLARDAGVIPIGLPNVEILHVSS